MAGPNGSYMDGEICNAIEASARLLPLIFDRFRGKSGSIILVISPLTLLMMDQRGRFTHKGLSTDFIATGCGKHKGG